MMDYESARQRLESPRNKDSKRLGHELTLSRQKRLGGEYCVYRLTYFTTDIIEYWPDGVLLNAGPWLSSSATRDKFNGYLPRGWRVDVARVRTDRAKLVGFVTRRDEHWNVLSCMPFINRLKYEYTRATYKYDASQLFETIWKKATEATEAFLRGRLSLSDAKPANMIKTGELLADDPRTYATIIKLALDSNWPEISPIHSYWKEYFRLTGRVRTQKDIIEQTEFFLVHGVRKRPPFHSEWPVRWRQLLRSILEDKLLQAAGFTYHPMLTK